mmetsp:Transcript_34267/g.63151  ORF Transcript_34267/g.63151 Transcript_34267/m.63151 type:complete len:554 (-) Transcript_34267:470-2131(-)
MTLASTRSLQCFLLGLICFVCRYTSANNSTDSKSTAAAAAAADFNNKTEGVNETIITDNNVAAVLQQAREEIESICRDHLQQNGTNMAAKFLRLAFHDALGGTDGCVDLTDPDNAGLDIPIQYIQPVVDRYASSSSLETTKATTTTGISRADIWALAALAGVEMSQDTAKERISFPLYLYGRRDCDDNDNDATPCFNTWDEPVPCGKTTTAAPGYPPPGPDLVTDELLQFFLENFGLTTRETIVAMGAHTFGVADRKQSGFHGPHGWVDGSSGGHRTFDNRYYYMLVGGSKFTDPMWKKLDDAPHWNKRVLDNSDMVLELNNGTGGTSTVVPIPDRFQWVRENFGSDPFELIMLNSDIALARDLSGRIDPEAGGRVRSCDFKESEGSKPRCPRTPVGMIDTLLEFKLNNTLWLVEFERVLNKFFDYGHDTPLASSDCDQDVGNGRGGCLMWVDERVRPPVIPVPTEAPMASPILDPPAAVDPTAIVPAPATPGPAGTAANTTPVSTEAEVKREAPVDVPVTTSDGPEAASLGLVGTIHIMASWLIMWIWSSNA